jgi:hypothetical protein
MVAETLLPERLPPPSRWERWRKRLMIGLAIVLAAGGVFIYYWFR